MGSLREEDTSTAKSTTALRLERCAWVSEAALRMASASEPTVRASVYQPPGVASVSFFTSLPLPDKVEPVDPHDLLSRRLETRAQIIVHMVDDIVVVAIDSSPERSVLPP